MATPTVTRPLANVESEEKPNAFLTEALPYLKWIVLAAVVLGIGALVFVGVTTLSERSRREDARQKWDLVYTAQKEKTKAEDRIAALEGIADKVKGSTAHAYVLTTLGQLWFDQAIKPEKSAEERTAALKKAAALFESVASNEPYKSNPAFGPQAAQHLALTQEHAQDYDAAIKTLTEAVDRVPLTHYLYNKLGAELGRLYYMRSLKKPAGSAEWEKDREEARKRLGDALKAMGKASTEDEERGGQDSQYISFLTYIKSIVDKPGRALPDGKAPPVKAPVAPAEKKDGEAGKKAEGENKDAPPAEATKDAPKPGEKKPEPEKKTEEKKADDKKSSLEYPDAGQRRHLSFAQLQASLRNGNTSFCECARCVVEPAPASAKMIE